MKKYFPLIFIVCGLFSLLAGAFMGVLISMVYVLPDFLTEFIPFNQLRPMHTSFVISWIILTVIGGIYFYISRIEGYKLYSPNLSIVHLILYLIIAVLIPLSLLTKNMGGREYLEFSPFLILPILIGWVFFGINYFKTVLRSVGNWPAYYWMWGIGIVFMIFHLSESNFWMFQSIREDFIRDMSIQWKSYGSFVGSWNMLVYGTALYLMSKVKDTVNIARGRTTFFFVFLGLTNLMFGWAHHTYILPTQEWVRYFAYGISMTEWIIFIKIVYDWSRSLTKADRKKYSMVYRFIIASDIWVFINLVMALLMSIPALNYYSHGTHITVAHSMGTTIGINTCILFASVWYITSKLNGIEILNRFSIQSFYLFNTTLAVFFIALIAMGVKKIIWQQRGASFAELHSSSHALYLIFIVSGTLLFCALGLIAIPLIKQLLPFCHRVVMPREMVERIEDYEEDEDSY